MTIDLFTTFSSQFRPDEVRAQPSSAVASASLIPELRNFLERFGGLSFNDGLYRVVAINELDDWAERLDAAYPGHKGRLTCFAVDWLGRAFALDDARQVDGQPGVLLLELGTGDALEVPCSLQSFHEDELINYREAALAESFYEQWRAAGGPTPKSDECIGYKKPLFLGGEDSVENLAVWSLDVYWHVTAQVLNQVRDLPPGARVRSASIG